MDTLSPPRSLVDQAYERILDAVCDGTFRPGERLTQEEIAARLNVSRQPITHALAMLKTQGFLTEAGRRGLMVAPFDEALLNAIYQFRSAVEPLAVRLATARIGAKAAAQGRALVEHGAAMVAAGDHRAVLAADVEFHAFIYELSGNPVIADAMQLNWRHLRRGMAEVLSHPGFSAAVWREHAAILEAMIAGDAELAARLMHDHMAGATTRAGV